MRFDDLNGSFREMKKKREETNLSEGPTRDPETTTMLLEHCDTNVELLRDFLNGEVEIFGHLICRQ